MAVEIGSSDAPVVLGVSPHKTPWKLWAELVGLITREEQTSSIMEWGSRLEGAVLDAVVDAHAIRSPVTRAYHFQRTWQRATPDAYDSERLYEVKCVIGHPPETPRVDWLVQVLHQMLVYESPARLIAYGNLSLVTWDVPRHQRALDRVLREEERFLELVEKEESPPVRAADAAVLARAWPHVRNGLVKLPEAALEWDRVRTEMRKVETQAREARQEAEAQLRAMIGDATDAVLPDGSRYTCYPHEIKEFTVPARTNRPLRKRGE